MLNETPEAFEAAARLLLAVKLDELGLLSTELAEVGLVGFRFRLGRFDELAVGVDPKEIQQDLANA